MACSETLFRREGPVLEATLISFFEPVLDAASTEAYASR